MRLEAFDGLRVAVLGYGREGRSAARLLAERTRPAVLDVYTGGEPAAESTNSSGSIHPGLPESRELSGYDVVIRSPGLSPYAPPLNELQADGPRVITGTDIWFAEHPDARTVVITGSKGKSTTAALTAHLLERSGRRVALGGNIGVPLLDLMDVDPEVWVIELSSYQIHGLVARPSIAVVLNLFPEHLDWHGTRERYFADKLSLIEGLGTGVAVLNHADAELRARAPADVLWYNDDRGIHCREGRACKGGRDLFSLEAFGLPGAHNRSNLCAALTVLDLLGVDPARAADWIGDFQALPHRLQSLGIRDGIEYVDDSISTTPQATIAALACYPDRPVTVLVGGFDRGLDWESFAKFMACRDKCRVVTFGALGPRIAQVMKETGIDDSIVTTCAGLDSAIEVVRSVTPAGGVALLSPGAPSFDAFKDYQARGREFARLAGFESTA